MNKDTVINFIQQSTVSNQEAKGKSNPQTQMNKSTAQMRRVTHRIVQTLHKARLLELWPEEGGKHASLSKDMLDIKYVQNVSQV